MTKFDNKTLQSRKLTTPRLTQVAALLASSAFAAMIATPAFGQQQQGPVATEAQVGLERIVVTATSTPKSKMRSSVSVTNVDQDQIKDFGARSEAEVLLLIPGIRTEPTAGPGGNSNISVRGLPITSGGSKYVQLQEDGLPTVQFGDMNFSNNDYWTRFDNNVDSIQTLRGGSSAVFASHAPGAVINYISKTGKDENGGSIGLTRGLNFNETRFDGDYGGHLAPDLYYHIGGYYREGEGSRNYTPNALLGYQVKGNITKEFNGGKGYVRVNFKALDEHAPTTPQTFLTATLSGNKYGNFGLATGFDGTRDSQYSRYNNSFTSIDPVTRALTSSSLNDGITSKSTSVGAEFRNELTNGYTLDAKFRASKNAGAFNAQFWDLKTLGNMLGGFDAGSYAKYANGPQVGQNVSTANLVTGLVSRGAAINVQTPDMGNLVNDVSVSKQFKLDKATLDMRGGYFYSRQNVVQRWAISERIMQAAPNGSLIDVYDATGAALTTMGLTGYNNQWGGASRDVNARFTTSAPYASVNAAVGQFDLDAGIRHESFKANGTYAGSKQVAGGLDINGDGLKTGAEKNVYVIDPANQGIVNYTTSYNNYSVGANFRVNNDLSVFARNSKGFRAIADRLLLSPNIDPVTGELTSGGKDAALAKVAQSEVGVKFRGRQPWGNYGASATYFRSTTNEFDYDQTRQDDPAKANYAGPKLNVVGYKADGIELETLASIGNFGVNLNLTYSDEVMTANLGDANGIGKTSGGVPKWRYTISPRYAIGRAVIGGTVRGQSKVFADGNNTTTIDGHYVVNAFVNYDFGKGLIGSLNVNNLFNVVYPTGGAGFVAGSSSIVGAGVENGRTVSASIKYKF